MRLFYSAFAVAMLSLFPADVSAENYLVREDRVWEYEGDPATGDAISFSYKLYFDGKKTVDGKEYSILRTKDSMLKEWVFPGPEIKEREIDNGQPFLLREEDGKVYIHSLIEGYGGYDWNSDNKEGLLYDFNAKEGDELEIVNPFGEKLIGVVGHTFNVTVGGEECKAYTFNMDDIPWIDYTVVQGMGNVTLGCIPYYVTDMITRSPAAFLPQELVRVTDLDGNVICGKTDGKWPWEKPAQAVKTVREDRLWNYDINLERLEGSVISSEYAPGYHFKGSVEKEGKTYMQFMDANDECVALMREEDGKVYLYLAEEWRNLGDEFAPVMVGSSEILLYDFGANIGDKYTLVSFSYPEMGGLSLGGLLSEATVTDTYTVKVGDEDMRALSLQCGGSVYTLVEGVGLDGGMLPFPQSEWTNTGMQMTYARLQTLTDLDGNVLFSGSAGMQTAETVISKDKSWYYISTTYPNSYFYLLYEMKFEGEVEANGKTYHGFVNTGVIEYDKGLDNPGARLPDEKKLKTSYFREEGDALYVLTSSGCPVVGEMNAAGEYSEELVMDFSLPDGAEFPSGLFCQDDFDEQLYIQYVDMETAEGIQGRRYFELYSLDGEGNKLKYAPIFGEGLGLINGIMPEFNLAWSTSMWDSFLLQVSEGSDILYKADGYEWFDPTKQDPNGVIGVEREKDIIISTADGIVSPNTDIAVIDLSGKRVADGFGSVSTAGLQPGVYVARTAGQSLKIVVR